MNLAPVVLEGRVVRLEPLTPDHVDALSAVGLDPSIWTVTSVRVRDADEMRRYVEKALAEQRAGTALPFATIERSTGSVVGTTRFRNAVAEHA
ncbi:MAG: GNAT family N-acetyltransferase, partial [Gemmatimonadaceae bacterium]